MRSRSRARRSLIILFFALFAGTSSASSLVFSGKEVLKAQPTEIHVAKADKGTVVAFLSARCPCSASHEPILKALAAEFSGKGFQFVAIHSNQDEDEAITKDHFTNSQLPFPVIQDSDTRYANQLGALKTPHVFVLAPSGEIAFQGGVDDSADASRAQKHYLRDALTALQSGRSPDIKEARALGCVIKR